MAFTWLFLWRLLTDACELVNDVSLVSAQGLVSTFHYSVLLVCLGVGVVHANAVRCAVVLHAISVILVVALGLSFVWLEGIAFHNLVGGSTLDRRIPLRDCAW
jgi:hypothetical protein